MDKGFLYGERRSGLGFFFLLVGAIASHAYMKDSIYQIFPAILLLLLTLVSWYFRPERKTIVRSLKNKS